MRVFGCLCSQMVGSLAEGKSPQHFLSIDDQKNKLHSRSCHVENRQQLVSLFLAMEKVTLT